MPNYGYHLARAEGNATRTIYRASLPVITSRPITGGAPLSFDVFAYSGEKSLPEQIASIRSFLKYVGRPKRFTIVSDGTLSTRGASLLKSLDPSIAISSAAEWVPKDLPAALYPYLTTHPTGKQLALIMSLPVEVPALYIDSDVLFFPAARELIQNAERDGVPAFYLPDCRLSADERLFRSEAEKAQPVNAGVLFLFKKLDWTLAVRRFLELDGLPTFFTNQTMTHLTMHVNGATALDPRKYVSPAGRPIRLSGSLCQWGACASSLCQSGPAQVLDGHGAARSLVMETPARPLRILLTVNLPWDSRLGAVRVYMELAEQWRASGNVVEKYSLSDAFPDARSSSARFTLRQVLFPLKAAAFVRKNGARFDVVDALIGVLPFSKRKLGFHGLLVARSVGLYRLFEEFDRSVEKRWPGRPRGTFLGRVFYSLTRWRLRKDSEKAIRHADLINLPNEEEADCLRRDSRIDRPIMVQPYGLTDERRQAFLRAAPGAEIRLAQKRVCFIGMWGARKGARDWPEIIRQIRVRIPGAQFRFLGTMVDSTLIRRDLQLKALEGVEFVSDYQPDALPKLLADCTVGAFPSYAEGFGLAVLEQLAAGIPTIAYDTAGPRDLLGGGLRELLVQKGDASAFAEKICGILQLDPDGYKKLAERSVECAADFSWSVISETTLSAYRVALGRDSGGKILFVQPFSLGSAGGGPRILRALLENAPFSWESVCTSPDRARPWPNERCLPSRPNWGRIERTRLAGIPNATAPFFAPMFRTRLRDLCIKLAARAIHTVPHAGLDFAEVHAVARELALPLFISVHDDIAYTAANAGRREHREAVMRTAWQEAAACFVISEALGREYCKRYGSRVFEVVTDGLSSLTPPQERTPSNELRIYFMGLFHMAYERNLRAFLDGLELFKHQHPSIRISLTCRCEHIRAQVLEGAQTVTILPFAPEAQVAQDMASADLLYMPLPFGEAHEKFARYSLSTKMVTYAGSGVPILYHGPATSVAYDLLSRHNAAIMITSLVPQEIAETLGRVTEEMRANTARNALALAERDFMLVDQTRRFWGAFATATFPR